MALSSCFYLIVLPFGIAVTDKESTSTVSFCILFMLFLSTFLLRKMLFSIVSHHITHTETTFLVQPSRSHKAEAWWQLLPYHLESSVGSNACSFSIEDALCAHTCFCVTMCTFQSSLWTCRQKLMRFHISILQLTS